MRKAIIRPWWGSRDRDDAYRANRRAMEATLDLVMTDTYQVPFVTYVFGDENYEYLKKKGLEAVLIDSDPSPRKSPKRNYIHRLDICKAALEDFDEIVCTNWNCRLRKPFPDYFWDQLAKKESLQAPLIQTRVKMLKSRVGIENRIFPNDAFIYMRDKSLPDQLLDVLNWNIPNKWTAESLMAHFLDARHGKWIGHDEYFKLYEPDPVLPARVTAFRGHKEDACFVINKSGKISR